MFSLELEFQDGVSPTEVMFVRRPFAVVGTADYAHVVIESAGPVTGDLRIARGLGRGFTTEVISQSGAGSSKGPQHHESEAEVDLGSVTARVIALDVDLQLLSGESPDQAGVRILRRSLLQSTPVFPAVAMLGGSPVVTSFPAEQGLLIGRSRSCGLRIDKADVSAEHAKIGYERGRFWIEDLGSSNGTHLGGPNGERVTGRRFLEKNDRVSIGAEITLACLESNEDLATLDVRGYTEKPVRATPKTYPCIVSNSDLVRPNRFSFEKTDRAVVGRDPASDIWIAASHISRTHAELALRPDGKFDVIDMSSNGTYRDGERLPRGIPITVPGELIVIDLNSGIQLALCHSKDDEIRFLEGNIGTHATTMVNQAVVDEAKSQHASGSRNRVLTPLEEAERLRAMEHTQQFERTEPRYPWETPPASAPKNPEVPRTEPPAVEDPAGFQRLISRDGWPTRNPQRPSEKFSAPRPEPIESEGGDIEEYEEPLLLYDPPSAGISRWVFIPSLVLLVLLIVAIWMADFG